MDSIGSPSRENHPLGYYRARGAECVCPYESEIWRQWLFGCGILLLWVNLRRLEGMALLLNSRSAVVPIRPPFRLLLWRTMRPCLLYSLHSLTILYQAAARPCREDLVGSFIGWVSTQISSIQPSLIVSPTIKEETNHKPFIAVMVN